jgi:hypothetical protein
MEKITAKAAQKANQAAMDAGYSVTHNGKEYVVWCGDVAMGFEKTATAAWMIVRQLHATKKVQA